MNKWLGLLLLSTFSLHSYAIENGTAAPWSSNHNDDIIKLYSADEINNCSGTLIAGKYVITAGHCVVYHANNQNIMSKITTARGQQIQIVDEHVHPLFDADQDVSYPDVAMSELKHSVDAQRIHFFADLTKDTVQLGAPLRVFGFGSTKEHLHYADFTKTVLVGQLPEQLSGNVVNQAHTIGGDSGSPWLDANGHIVATHEGSFTSSFKGVQTRTTYSSNLHYSQQFILDTVNGWHYPTLAYTSNGKATVTVQSLHVNPTVDMAYASDDVTITGGTCTTMGAVSAFQTCTYEIKSTGGVGTLHLSDTESVAINKVFPSKKSDSDSSGGSLGGVGLLLLSGFGLLRRKKTHE